MASTAPIIYDDWTHERAVAFLPDVQRTAPELEWLVLDHSTDLRGIGPHGAIIATIRVHGRYGRPGAAEGVVEVAPPWVLPGLPPRADVTVSWRLPDPTEADLVVAAKLIGAWIRTGNLAPAGSVLRGKPRW